jgi:hypothetical protein
VGDVFGAVVVHRQLVEDDLTLALDIVVAQRRVGEHVAEQLDAEADVTRRHPAVVRGVLLGGEGVDVAADAVDRLRDVDRRPRRACP